MFKITNHPKMQRHLIYFGILIIVPDDVKYIVTDELGYVLGFTGMPEISKITVDNTRPRWKFQNQYPVQLTKVNFTGDWKQSLMKIPN